MSRTARAPQGEVTSRAHPSAPPPPHLLLVDDDVSALAGLGRELEGRYGSDYRVECLASPATALERLERLSEEGDEVALVIADQWMPGTTGIDFLTRCQALHPDAKRALLIGFGDASASEPILGAMTLGKIDYYLTKPWVPADDMLHPTISELLGEWTRARRPRPAVVRIVGETWEARSHEIRDLLDRNGVPFRFHAADSEEGRELLESHGVDRLPSAFLHDGRVLMRPSNTDMAEALGASTTAPAGLFDLAVVGGGPAGLAAAVYAGSEGLRTVVVEDQAVGGQAGTSALIRNYLGFPRGLSGAALAERAYRQAFFFGAKFVFFQRATSLRVEGHRRIVGLSDGSEIEARAVVLATGVSYRRLGVPSIDGLLGRGVFYGAARTEAKAVSGEEVYVLGAGNSAGQATCHLARHARGVTMLVRGDTLASSMSDYLVREIDRLPNVSVRFGVEVLEGLGEHRLAGLLLRDRASGATSEVPAAALFVMIGATPTTDWMPVERDPWGYVLTGPALSEDGESSWPLERPAHLLETSVPGVFAVGDVRSRSVKRVASAVGDGSIVVSMVHQVLNGTS